MYYTAKQFVTYAMHNPRHLGYLLRSVDMEPSPKTFRLLHKKAMAAIVDRNTTEIDVWKWFRPWDVVPELRNYRAPEGDFGVGIEIELGFRSQGAAQQVARKVKNWRHITLDFEGGSHPIEATFPPQDYSKFGGNSQPCRYLKLVDGLGTCIRHQPTSMVGIHVNVSVGGRTHSGRTLRYQDVNNYILYNRGGFGEREQVKYFGRYPYGGINSQDTHYECKMFNSTTDWKVLRRYVDIAVELIKLIEGQEPITSTSVIAACERGYTRR